MTVFDLKDSLFSYRRYSTLDRVITIQLDFFSLKLCAAISSNDQCLLLIRLKIYSVSLKFLKNTNEMRIRPRDFPNNNLTLVEKSVSHAYIWFSFGTLLDGNVKRFKLSLIFAVPEKHFSSKMALSLRC